MAPDRIKPRLKQTAQKKLAILSQANLDWT
jgi:hypothetical protein